MDREEILAEIRRVADKLGVSQLSRSDFARHASVSPNLVERSFATWNAAIEAAGLSPFVANRRIAQEILLEDLRKVVDNLGKFPTINEYSVLGRHDPGVLTKKWGGWSGVRRAYYSYMGIDAPTEYKPASKGVQTIDPTNDTENRYVNSQDGNTEATDGRVKGTYVSGKRRSEYGNPVDFRGLRHAPINEQGVVYLFGMISRELGFLVEAVRTEFPDCEAKREIPGRPGRWEPVRIEFEFRCSAFKAHGHDPDGCDIIVCWNNDWPDCPLEVVELRTVIQRLSAQV